MTFEYEGIFVISWFFRIFILALVSNKKLNLYYSILPLIFLILYLINYDIVFWGEILFLPLALLAVKSKFGWNWLQYIFYSLFPFVIFDIFSNFANIYSLFLFKVSQEQWYEFDWSELIDLVIAFFICIGFFKLLRIDFKEIGKQFRQTKPIAKVFPIIDYSLIIYIFTVYLINDFIFLQYGGELNTTIDLVYIRRHFLVFYLVFMIGMIFYINFLTKENKEKELQEQKDNQIKDLTSYSNHIESLYKEIRSFRHDYTNLLSSLNQAIKNRDLEGIEQIYETVLADSDKQLHTSQYDIANLSNLENDALKSLVSVKMIEAQNKGIDLSVEVEDKIDAPTSIELINLLKIVSIFLDNALESTVHSKTPYLSFAYFKEGGSKIMIVENTTCEKKINTKSIFEYGQSSKGENRGIGLANVKAILASSQKVDLKTYSDNYRFRHELVFYEINCKKKCNI